MRVAILNAGHMDHGGTERVVACQARGLHQRGYDVGILTPTNNPDVYREVIPSNVSPKPWWHTIPSPILKRSINRLLHFWFGGKALREFDILIAHNQPAPYAAYKSKKKNGKPYLVYCHAPWRRLYPREVDLASGWASDYREKMMFIRRSYWYRLDRDSIIGADAHLVNSRKTSGEVKQIYGVEAEICYPGIDYEKYHDIQKEDVDKVVEKHGIDEFSLLVVGRHAPQKRLEWIPTIVTNLEKSFPHVKVLVTGRPNNLVTPRLIDEAKRLNVEGKISMVGAVPERELIALYHACPILIYNAVYEDFGLPPIEAMACGCVPVAWDEGAGPCETIIEGRTGLLARPYDLNDFSEKVAFLMADPMRRTELAYAGMKEARRYDWTVHLDILEETLRKVVGTSG